LFQPAFEMMYSRDRSAASRIFSTSMPTSCPPRYRTFPATMTVSTLLVSIA
jgi:hypothetical protein